MAPVNLSNLCQIHFTLFVGMAKTQLHTKFHVSIYKNEGAGTSAKMWLSGPTIADSCLLILVLNLRKPWSQKILV